MKRIAYSVLLIIVMSCGRARSPMMNHIVLKLSDSLKKDYFLLAVHDSSLIVAPYSSGETLQLGTLIGAAEAIPFTQIKEVIHPERATGGDDFLGGLTGCGIFGCIGGCMALNDGFKGTTTIPQWIYPLSPFIGIGIGVLFAEWSLHNDIRYYLDSKTHLDALRLIAYYSKQEPPQLLLLK